MISRVPATVPSQSSRKYVQTILLVLVCFPTLVSAQDAIGARSSQDHLYRAVIAAAEKALRLNEAREAKYWLSQAPVTDRGWEWHYLHSLCDESVGSTSIGELDVTSIDVSPDGNQLAAAMINGEIKLFALPDLTEVGSISAHSEAIYSVSYSNDGKRLVTISRDVTCRVWNIETQKEISQVKMVNPGVAAATFSPDGKYVALCSWKFVTENGARGVKGIVWIWNALSGEILHKNEVGIKPLDSIVWSRDGNRIVCGSWGGFVHCLDHQGKELAQLRVPDDGVYNSVLAVDISPDGKWIAGGSKDRTVRLWNADSFELASTLTGHSGFVNEVRFMPDGKELVSASDDGTIRSWRVDTGKPTSLRRGHDGSVQTLGMDVATSRLYSIGKDHQLKRWEPGSVASKHVVERIDTSGTYSAVWSPDGKRIYVACFDGKVRVVDGQSGKLVQAWTAHPGQSCNTLSLSNDGTRLLTCSWDKTAKVWNAIEGTIIATFEPNQPIYDCAIEPGGKVAALTIGSSIELWDVATSTRVGTCEGSNCARLLEVGFSANGLQVAAAGESGNAAVWDVRSQKLVATLGTTKGQFARLVNFSPDGKWIVTTGAGIASLWETANYQLVREYRFGDREANGISFSPDSSRVAIGSDAITIFSPATAGAILRFQPNDDDIYHLNFSPDGHRIASCTTGGSLAISDGRPED